MMIDLDDFTKQESNIASILISQRQSRVVLDQDQNPDYSLGFSEDGVKVESYSDFILETDSSGTQTIRAIDSYTLTDAKKSKMMIDLDDFTKQESNIASILISQRRSRVVLDQDQNPDYSLGFSEDGVMVESYSDFILETDSSGTQTIRAIDSYTLTDAQKSQMMIDLDDFTKQEINITSILISQRQSRVVLDQDQNPDYSLGFSEDGVMVESYSDFILETDSSGTQTIRAIDSYTLTDAQKSQMMIDLDDFTKQEINITSILISQRRSRVVLDQDQNPDYSLGFSEDGVMVESYSDFILETDSSGTQTIRAIDSYTLTDAQKSQMMIDLDDFTKQEINITSILISQRQSRVVLDQDQNPDYSLGFGEDGVKVESYSDFILETDSSGTQTIRAIDAYQLTDAQEDQMMIDLDDFTKQEINITSILISQRQSRVDLDQDQNPDYSLGFGEDGVMVESYSDFILETKSDGTKTIRAIDAYELTDAQEDQMMIDLDDFTKQEINI